MTENKDEQLRVEALSQAVRVTLSQGEEVGTVERAEDYYAFLAARRGTPTGTLALVQARTNDAGKLTASDLSVLIEHYEPVLDTLAKVKGLALPSGLHKFVAVGEVTSTDLDRAIAFVLTGPTGGE